MCRQWVIFRGFIWLVYDDYWYTWAGASVLGPILGYSFYSLFSEHKGPGFCIHLQRCRLSSTIVLLTIKIPLIFQVQIFVLELILLTILNIFLFLWVYQICVIFWLFFWYKHVSMYFYVILIHILWRMSEHFVWAFPDPFTHAELLVICQCIVIK